MGWENAVAPALAAAIRALVKIIQAKPAVTNESKQAIGITIADTTKTAVAVPITAPVGCIEQLNRLEHTVHFADSTMPTMKAKPAGVRGAQIWVKIGTTNCGPTSPKSGVCGTKPGSSLFRPGTWVTVVRGHR